MEKRIVLLFGGESSEYEISLASASAIIQTIKQTTYQLSLIGITRKGEWLLFSGDVEKIRQDTWSKDPSVQSVQFAFGTSKPTIITRSQTGEILTEFDLCFPVLHGKQGEDGTIQGLLELAHIPYVGCGVLTSALAMDKVRCHQLVASHDILVPKSLSFSSKQIPHEKLTNFIEDVGWPIFVKPVRGGSSLGINKIERVADLVPAIQLASEYDQRVTVEQGINGFEVGCGVLGNQEIQVGEVDEIELLQDFFSFKEKYELLTAKIHLPARISKEQRLNIQETAKRIYRIIGCTGLSRIDFFLQPDGALIFNEINTMPGFTEHSRFPSMFNAVGFSYQQTIEQLIELGLDVYGE